MQLLLQFYSNSFETLPLFSHGLKMCILFGLPSDFFCHFFYKMNFVIFPAKVNRYQVSCVYATPPTVLC